VFDWPADGVVRVPTLSERVSGARFLATGATFEVARDGDGWRIDTGAATAPDPIDTVVVLDVAG
jgi:hypothetical protein